jgi:putative aminopeptidase FrvX
VELNVKDTIQKLVEAFGPVGYEDQVRSIIRKEIAGLADQISVSKLGSLIAFKKGSGTGQKIMLAAHMDEIGIIVTHIDKHGFVRFAPLGGVFTLYSITGRVQFANGQIGVIGLEQRDDTTKSPTLDQLYIDVGATDKSSCPVQVGDVAIFHRPLGSIGSRITGKSLDDRIGCAVLIETLRRLKSTPHDIYFVFSVQEEVNSSGARTSAYSIDPDLALAIDLTDTGDVPKALPMAVELGKGPAIKVKDVGMIADPRIKEWMVKRAEAARIPYQLEILRQGTTDAEVIQSSRDGVPSGALSIPGRYIHSASEMVDLSDVENAVKLLLALISKPIDL